MAAVLAPEITITWTTQQIEDVVLELLGEELGSDPDELRNELEEKGAGMPVDSLVMFDILVEFRQRTGLRIPKRRLKRQTMRSVKSFAEFIVKEGQS